MYQKKKVEKLPGNTLTKSDSHAFVNEESRTQIHREIADENEEGKEEEEDTILSSFGQAWQVLGNEGGGGC